MARSLPGVDSSSLCFLYKITRSMCAWSAGELRGLFANVSLRIAGRSLRFATLNGKRYRKVQNRLLHVFVEAGVPLCVDDN